MALDSWEIQTFDPYSTNVVEQEQAVRFAEFVEEYSSQLRELEEALQPSLSEMSNPELQPLKIDTSPYEALSFIELVKTDNKLFDKVVLVFSSLVAEMKKLSQLTLHKYIPPFLLFGTDHTLLVMTPAAASGPSSSSSPGPEIEDTPEGEAQIQIGRLLPFVVELSAFISRCYTVIRNVIRQLASLYHQEQPMYKQSFQYFHLSSVWAALGELLCSLMTLDEVLRANESLSTCWSMYRRMALVIRSDAARYGTEEEDMLKFEKLFSQLEGILFDGLIFQNAVDQEFDFPGIVSVRKNATFRNEFITYLKAETVFLSSRSSTPADRRALSVTFSSRYMALCGLFACYFAIFKTSADKKLFQAIWDMYMLFPMVHLVGDVVWTSTDFLSKKVLLVHTLPKQDISGFRATFLKKFQDRFVGEIQQLTIDCGVWMVRIESNLTNRADLSKLIETRIDLLVSGMRLALRLSETFNNFVSMHTKLRRPLRPSDVPLLCKLVELLKGIQVTFFRRESIISETMAYMVLQIAITLQAEFVPLKRRLQSDQKQLSPARLDALAALGCALSMLNSPATENRRIVLHLCTHIFFPISGWKEPDMEFIRMQLERLDFVSTFQESLSRVCNTAFLFWNQTFLPVYFANLKFRPAEASKLPYMLSAIRDVAVYLKHAVHESADAMIKAFSDDIMSLIQNEIIKHLQTQIENDLRSHVHSHLKVEDRDPFKTGVANYRPFLDLPLLRFFDGYLDLRTIIAQYLDKTFYNLNTVMLSDWKTYSEMRNLAREKYGLILTDSHLPGATLEQGMDVLEIMRAIHVFVAKFSYNLNNQIFIERSSESKFLNTINIQHIANSIRTHGTGIMNTAVNFIFQFLKRKFNVFSQFLYDDYIKSHLYRDVRFFKEHRTELENQYSYERAEQFNKEIRKLGMNDKGQSYMDQFRNLITEIGNAMGYVRMIRSAGMLFTSDSIKFVPDLVNIPKFLENTTSAGLSPSSIEAAKNLDSTLETLAKNFAEGTDYFKLLVAVFCTQFRDDKQTHLLNFYSIIPPLTINFVEHSLQMKEKLSKKKAFSGGIFEGSNFTDDGFAIGLAYILKLLDQNNSFNSLHWFDSIHNRYQRELLKVEDTTRKALEEQKKRKKASSSDARDSEISQSLQLTTKKLKNYQLEFQLLRYSFEGARIFFKE